LADTGSFEGIRMALRRLAETGLLHVDQRTSGTFYRLNRDHLAYPAVDALFGMRLRLTRLVAEAIGGWPEPPVHASFFGSYVRQDGGVDSDIDLLVVFDDEAYDDDERWSEAVASLERSIQLWTGNPATALTMSVRDLKAMANGKRAAALWKSLRSEALLVYGTELTKVIR
jgi:predicted nucleotidyltransferase